MQLRPAGRVLEGIVRTIVGTPSYEVPKVAALVVVLREVRFRRRYAVSENPPLQRCPLGRGHWGCDVDRGSCSPKKGERQKAEDRKQRHLRTHNQGDLLCGTGLSVVKPSAILASTLRVVFDSSVENLVKSDFSSTLSPVCGYIAVSSPLRQCGVAAPPLSYILQIVGDSNTPEENSLHVSMCNRYSLSWGNKVLSLNVSAF